MEDRVVAILIALREQRSRDQEYRCNGECPEVPWT